MRLDRGEVKVKVEIGGCDDVIGLRSVLDEFRPVEADETLFVNVEDGVEEDMQVDEEEGGKEE